MFDDLKRASVRNRVEGTVIIMLKPDACSECLHEFVI